MNFKTDDDLFDSNQAVKKKEGANWALLVFLFFLPLVNLQHKFFPPLPGGINFMNVMFAFSLIGAFWKGGGIHWGRSLNKWLIIYILYLVLSYMVMLTMLTLPVERSLNSLKDFIFVICLVYIVQMSINSFRDVQYILLALLAPLPYIFRVIFGQYQSVAQWHYSDDLRVNGTMSDLGANEMGAFLVTASILAVVLAFYLKPDKLWQKALIYISVPCALLSLMYTYSRGGYVAVFAAAVVFYFYKKNKGKLTVVLLLVFVVSPLIIPVSVFERFQSINVEEGERDQSAQSRFVFWAAAFEKAKESPIIGFGYRSWGSPEINSVGMDTHNYFVKTIVEGGVIGILLLLALFIAAANLARFTTKNSTSELAKGIGIILLCVTIGLLVGNMFGDRFSHPSVIYIFWALCGVCIKVNYLHEDTPKTSVDVKPINIFEE